MGRFDTALQTYRHALRVLPLDEPERHVSNLWPSWLFADANWRSLYANWYVANSIVDSEAWTKYHSSCSCGSFYYLPIGDCVYDTGILKSKKSPVRLPPSCFRLLNLTCPTCKCRNTRVEKVGETYNITREVMVPSRSLCCTKTRFPAISAGLYP